MLQKDINGCISKNSLVRKCILFSVLCSSGGFCLAQSRPASTTSEDFVVVRTNAQGKSDTIHLNLRFPSGPGNTGATTKSNTIANLDKTLKANGVVCPPKRQKIANNVWICGDGTKYVSSNKKLNALLEELWNENE